MFKRGQKGEEEKMKDNRKSRNVEERREQRRDWSTPKRQIENRPRKLVDYMNKNGETEQKEEDKKEEQKDKIVMIKQRDNKVMIEIEAQKTT